MGRLIDVDKAMKQLDPNTWQGEMLIAILNGLPIAYDVDGVVEQLEKMRHPYTPFQEGYGTLNEYDYYIDKAITIVKGGSKDELNN